MIRNTSDQSTTCPLCRGSSVYFHKQKDRVFFICTQCGGVFVPAWHHPSAEAEFQRYLKHRNDVHNPGYKASVQPVIDYIQQNYAPSHQGLDFGCGPASAVMYWLKEAGYNIVGYDPFFEPSTRLEEENYDYITCTEVIEHFRRPAETFGLLYSLLRPGGQLVCTTKLLPETGDFKNWYYKNDLTHLFFYTETSLYKVAELCGFKSYAIDGLLIKFVK
ncbi:MAG: class I SAM-dependent methyltransferase [Bacteroidetes bacterium]|nr:class I SAM-dependent methyltransferase [Bacteroidota bacterium]